MPSGQPAGRRRYKMQLPATAGAAAAGTASPESSETAATAAEAATTASITTATAAAQSGKKDPEQDTAQGCEQDDQQNDAQNEQLFSGQPSLGRALGRCELWAIAGQLDAGILRDDVGDPCSHQRYGAVVVILPQQRDRFAAKASDLAIRQDRFQPVADFDAVFVVLHRQQDQDSVVRGFAPDSPLLVQGHGVALDVGAVQGIYCDHGNLRLRFLVELLADVIELRDGGLIKDVSEVVDVVGGAQLGDRLG